MIVSKIRFHPEKPNSLLAGSEDGLLCLFDLSQSNEEDAINIRKKLVNINLKYFSRKINATCSIM